MNKSRFSSLSWKINRIDNTSTTETWVFNTNTYDTIRPTYEELRYVFNKVDTKLSSIRLMFWAYDSLLVVRKLNQYASIVRSNGASDFYPELNPRSSTQIQTYTYRIYIQPDLINPKFDGTLTVNFMRKPSMAYYTVGNSWATTEPYMLILELDPSYAVPNDPGYGPIIPGSISLQPISISGVISNPIRKLNIDSVWASKPSELLHGPEKAIDGILSTTVPFNSDGRWAANLIPIYFYIKLDKPYNVKYIQMSFNYWDNSRIYTYNIDASMDGAFWNLIIPSKQSALLQEWVRDDLNVQAQYIRINITGNSQSTWAGLWEVEVYGNN